MPKQTPTYLGRAVADVFISYSKEDVADARMLSTLLEANGYTVWWDTNLAGGEQFRKKITSELNTARAVIVIWTKSSIVSDWVQSEAGRALADEKLVPIRSSEIEYKDIPPPFENWHTLTLNQTEQILAAVAGQLAKPASRGPLLKVFQHEVLLWLAIIGGAITLTTNVRGLFTLSAIFSWLISNWIAGLTWLWQALFFFKIEVSPFDAEFLTIAVLLTSAIFYSSSQRLNRSVSMSRSRELRWVDDFFPEVTSFLQLCLSLLVIIALMAIGLINIQKRELMKDTKTWEQLVHRIFVEDFGCLKIVKEARRTAEIKAEFGRLESRRVNREARRANREARNCYKSVDLTGLSVQELALVQEDPFASGYGRGSVWHAFVHFAPSDVTLFVFWLITVSSPISLPFAVYWAASSFIPLKLKLSLLSRRLFRTLFLSASLLVINFFIVKLEGWLKVIPRAL